ncbi:MAG: protein-L-isoaspartate(D-aspartate) O-methyltransferase [bacterium]
MYRFIISLLVSAVITTCGLPVNAVEDTFLKLRREMVQKQIRLRGIKDERVLSAIIKVERHKFVLENMQQFAYEDYPLPIGENQTISQPYIVALMTELLQLDGTEKVLEIGTGSGYQTAILCELAKEVYSIELLEPLAKRAEKLLKSLKYKNVSIRAGDGYLGWPDQFPFDAIIITCAPSRIPEPLIDQLAEGGRLVVPVGKWFQELQLLQKKNGKIITLDILPVSFVPMKGIIESK